MGGSKSNWSGGGATGSKLLEMLNVRVVGNADRPALVLSHGFGTDQSAWNRIVPYFQRDYRIVLYDLVCAGSVNPDHFDFRRYVTLDAYVDDLLAILDALRIERCFFVGHSVSAMIGILAAIRRPNAFLKLILIGASPRFLNDEDYHGGFEEGEIETVFAAMKSNYEAWVRGFAPLAVGADVPEAVREFSRTLFNMRPDITLFVSRTVFNSDLRGVLGLVQVPCVIVQTARDVSVPLSVARYLNDRLGGRNTIEVLHHTEGHLPHLSAPAALVPVIRRSLSGFEPSMEDRIVQVCCYMMKKVQFSISMDFTSSLNTIVNDLNFKETLQGITRDGAEHEQARPSSKSAYSKDLLSKTGIIDEVEDADHVLMTCNYASSCWQQLRRKGAVRQIPTTLLNLVDLIFYNSNGRQRQSFDGNHVGNWGSKPLPNIGRTSAQLVHWLPHNPRILKVNFDAAVAYEKAAAGFIIRNHEGCLIQAGGKSLMPISVPYVELVMAWLGLRAPIIELNATDVWLEGDSLNVIHWLTKSSSDAPLLMPIFEDILCWKSSLHSFKVSHVFREANLVADYIAKAALQGDCSWRRGIQISHIIASLLQVDAEDPRYRRY